MYKNILSRSNYGKMTVTEYCILLQNTTKYLGNCHAKHTCTCYISAMVGLILACVLLAKIIKFRKKQTTGTVLGFSWIQQHGWGDFLCLFMTVPTLKQELRQFFLLSGCNINFTCRNWNICVVYTPLESVSTESEVCCSSAVVFTHQVVDLIDKLHRCNRVTTITLNF